VSSARARCLVRRTLAVVLLASAAAASGAAPAPAAATAADRALEDYFRTETDALSASCLADIKSAADWTTRRAEYRRQLFEMLGLWPLPERTELKPAVTGRIEREGFAVEKLHFQSLPGLYVTANLYLPKPQARPAPAVLYVCGHALVKTNGVSYGNKVGYQHHGIWFARHGYVCLLIDSVQLGEIEGLHHGTYRQGLWWWNARGYTPAGVEAWNSIRALDLLSARPEVDAGRIGMTGRSGGGSYTWTTAALDDRVKVAAPVAGMTDLRNQIVDGCIDGHCDCMFFVNTHRWDFALNAALIAPRPLLIVNTDADRIFPLDGVQRIHAKLQPLYRRLGASTNLGLVIGPGPHKDTQDLQVPVFRWFNTHLKGEDPLVADAAVKLFRPEDLKVFSGLPADQRNTTIDEHFVPVAARPPAALDEARAALRAASFSGWPESSSPLDVTEVLSVKRAGIWLRAFDFSSQPHVRLRLFAAQAARVRRPGGVRLEVHDDPSWDAWLASMQSDFGAELGAIGVLPPAVLARAAGGAELGRELEEMGGRLERSRVCVVWLAPRGVGPAAWSGNALRQTQIRRRFMLLGQTVDGMRVWDIRRGLEALRHIRGLAPPGAPVSLYARGSMAANALYAALFEDEVASLELSGLAGSHRDGPDYLNVLRVLDIPQALGLLGERIAVVLGPGMERPGFAK
jgi:dienelactone hydrolase